MTTLTEQAPEVLCDMDGQPMAVRRDLAPHARAAFRILEDTYSACWLEEVMVEVREDVWRPRLSEYRNLLSAGKLAHYRRAVTDEERSAEYGDETWHSDCLNGHVGCVDYWDWSDLT